MADFGLTEDMHGTNFFSHSENIVESEEKVPIKWMAPESIERSIYNETTDVVSVFTCLFGKLVKVSPSVKVMQRHSFVLYILTCRSPCAIGLAHDHHSHEILSLYMCSGHLE